MYMAPEGEAAAQAPAQLQQLYAICVETVSHLVIVPVPCFIDLHMTIMDTSCCFACGSYLCLLLACFPAVWKNQPYNEKADVFSFGVVS
jgi:hypothetical protein